MNQDQSPAPSPADAAIGIDAYRPARIAILVEEAGVAKANLPWAPLLTLGVLAGAFIAFGAAFYLAVLSGVEPVTGPVRLAAAAAFSVGLILVVVGGAELFTGNALMVMALVDGRIGITALLRNWGIVYLGNLIGALLIAGLMWNAGLIEGGLARVAAKAAAAKFAITPDQAVARGILCNALVCLAVWLSLGARTAGGKAFVVIFPVAAFVALGFEHSVANMFLIPVGLIAGAEGGLAEAVANLVPVTLGNIIGGAGGVGLSYWICYGRTAAG